MAALQLAGCMAGRLLGSVCHVTCHVSQQPLVLFGRCGQQPTCTKQTPGNTTCEPPLAKDQHMGSSCF
jgi:hypothetical protein